MHTIVCESKTKKAAKKCSLLFRFVTPILFFVCKLQFSQNMSRNCSQKKRARIFNATHILKIMARGDTVLAWISSLFTIPGQVFPTSLLPQVLRLHTTVRKELSRAYTTARIYRKGECLLNKLAQARRKEGSGSGSGNTLNGGRTDRGVVLVLYYYYRVQPSGTEPATTHCDFPGVIPGTWTVNYWYFYSKVNRCWIRRL